MPDYLDAIRRGRRTGDPTEYCDVAQGHCAEDVTTFIVGQAEWSLENLPNILYTLEQPKEQRAWAKSQPLLPFKLDTDGRPMMERWPLENQAVNARPLRNIPVLPDQICSAEEWWRIEAWRRLDPRISFNDISMRQMPELGIRTRIAGLDRPNLANLIHRHREPFSILNWYGKNAAAAQAEKVCERLSLEQLQNNTTRGTTPGLIDPKKGDVPGNRIPLPGPKKKPVGPQPLMKRAPVSGPEAPDPRLIYKPNGIYQKALVGNRKYVEVPINWKQVRRTPSPPSTQHRQSQEEGDEDLPADPDLSDSAMDMDPSEVSSERLLEQTVRVPRSRFASRTMSISDEENAQTDDAEAVSASQSEYDEDSEEDELAVLDEMIREEARLERGRTAASNSKLHSITESADEDVEDNRQEESSDSDSGSNSSTPSYLEYTVTDVETGETHSVLRPTDRQQLNNLKALIREEARAEQIWRDEQNVVSNQRQTSSKHVMESDSSESAKRLSNFSNNDPWTDALRPSDEQQLDELDTLIHEADIAEKGIDCAGDSESNESLVLSNPHEGSDRKAKGAEPVYEVISEISSSKTSDSPNLDADLTPPGGGAKKTQEDTGITSRRERSKPSQQVVESELPENVQIINPSNSKINPWTQKPWDTQDAKHVIYALPVRHVPEAPVKESITTTPISDKAKRKRKRTKSSKPVRAKNSFSQEMERGIDPPQDASMRASSEQDSGSRYNLRQRINNVNTRNTVSISSASDSESGSEFERPERPERRFVLEAIKAKQEAEQAATKNERFLEVIKAKREAQKASERNGRLATDTKSDVSAPGTSNSNKSDSDVDDSRPATKRSRQEYSVPVDASSKEATNRSLIVTLFTPGRSINLGGDASRSRSFDIPEDAMGVDLAPIGFPFAGLSEPNNDVAMTDSDKFISNGMDSPHGDSRQVSSHHVDSDRFYTNSSQEEPAGSTTARPIASSTVSATTIQVSNSTGVLVEKMTDLGSRVSSLPPQKQSSVEPLAKTVPSGNSKEVLVEEVSRGSSLPVQERPSGKTSASSARRGNFMDTLVDEVLELGSRVSSLPPQDEPSGEPLGRRVDRVAKMVMDLQAGSERLLDEVASLREIVDRFDKRW